MRKLLIYQCPPNLSRVSRCITPKHIEKDRDEKSLSFSRDIANDTYLVGLLCVQILIVRTLALCVGMWAGAELIVVAVLGYLTLEVGFGNKELSDGKQTADA